MNLTVATKECTSCKVCVRLDSVIRPYSVLPEVAVGRVKYALFDSLQFLYKILCDILACVSISAKYDEYVGCYCCSCQKVFSVKLLPSYFFVC